MKIKVCGITSLEQLQQLKQLGVDYAGLIFFEGSKRYMEDKLKEIKSAVRETRKAMVFQVPDVLHLADPAFCHFHKLMTNLPPQPY